MVHQHFRLVEPLTVAENVMLGWHTPRFWLERAAGGAPDARDLRRASACRSTLTRRIWQLSVGEQQRVEIIKAVFRGSRILILDEPTAVLTPQEAEQLFATLRTMAREGHTVIVITHKLHEVKAVADRVTVLRRRAGSSRRSTRAEATPAVAGRAHGRPGDRRGAAAAARSAARRRRRARGRGRSRSQGDRGAPALNDVSLAVRVGRDRRRRRRRRATASGSWPRRSTGMRAAGRRLRSVSAGRRSAPAIHARRSRPAIAHVPEDRLGTGLAPSLSDRRERRR